VNDPEKVQMVSAGLPCFGSKLEKTMTVSEDSSYDDSMFLREFVKHQPALRAYARALLPDWNAVDEAVQEASLVMWRKIHQLQSENDFLPWAKTVLRFEALKVRRKFARDKHVFNDELIEVLAHEELEDETPFASMREALDGCLNKMSPSNRELVMAPYHADGAVTEIAEKSGRTVNSLYKLLGRIRLKLRQCIEEAIVPDQARVAQ